MTFDETKEKLGRLVGAPVIVTFGSLTADGTPLVAGSMYGRLGHMLDEDAIRVTGDPQTVGYTVTGPDHQLSGSGFLLEPAMFGDVPHLGVPASDGFAYTHGRTLIVVNANPEGAAHGL